LFGPWSKFSGDNVRKGCAIRFRKPKLTLPGFHGNFWRYFSCINIMMNDFVIVMTIFKILVVSPFPVAKIILVCLSKGIFFFAWIPDINFTMKGEKNKTCRVFIAESEQ